MLGEAACDTSIEGISRSASDCDRSVSLRPAAASSSTDMAWSCAITVGPEMDCDSMEASTWCKIRPGRTTSAARLTSSCATISISRIDFNYSDKSLLCAAGIRFLRIYAIPSLMARLPTADRDAFQRYVCHTSKRMSCQTPGIRQGSEAQRRGKGTPSRRQVTYVPYDPSFEMPAWGGPNERLTGDSIPGESRPAEYSWPCLSRRSRLSSSRGSFALRSVPRVTSAPIFGDPSQLSGCPNGSISRWPATRGAAQASDAP